MLLNGANKTSFLMGGSNTSWYGTVTATNGFSSLNTNILTAATATSTGQMSTINNGFHEQLLGNTNDQY